jgi:hypothetical protein
MESFQKFVLISAIVILIIALIIIGITLTYSNKRYAWPPNVPACPDWWVLDGSGNNQKCLNVKDLGICNTKEMDFSSSLFTGSTGACNKYTWANKCKVAWDGITYGVPNPCSTTSTST